MVETATLEECVVTFSRGDYEYYDKEVHIVEIRDKHSGELHNPLDQPAQTFICVETSKVVGQHYFKHGMLSRKHGPAIEADNYFYKVSGWFLDGQEHRDPNDGPSMSRLFVPTRIEELISYMLNGNLAKKNGPSCLMRSAATGVVTYENWSAALQENLRKIPFFIDVIHRNDETGEIEDLHYFKYGEHLHWCHEKGTPPPAMVFEP